MKSSTPSPLPIASGGTGATSASAARTALGLTSGAVGAVGSAVLAAATEAAAQQAMGTEVGVDVQPYSASIARVWSVDVTPSGLDPGYERGAGVGGLTLWNPSGTGALVSETAFGLSGYPYGGPIWSIPATQWSITTYAGYSGPNTATSVTGIVIGADLVGAPTTAKLMKFILEIDGYGEAAIYAQTWNSWSSFSANVFSLTSGLGYRAGTYMRVSSDGVATTSNWYLSISLDGICWLEIATGTWSTVTGGVGYRGVLMQGTSTAPAIYPWIRNRSGASEYRAPHIEGGLIG